MIVTTLFSSQPEKVENAENDSKKKRCGVMNCIQHQKYVGRRVRMAVKEIIS